MSNLRTHSFMEDLPPENEHTQTVRIPSPPAGARPAGQGLADVEAVNMPLKPMKAPRPSMYTHISNVQAGLQRQHLIVMFAVGLVFVVLAAQFALTLVAFEWLKETKVSDDGYLVKKGGETMTPVFTDTKVQALKIEDQTEVLSAAWLEVQDHVALEKGFKFKLYHKVTGHEVRPCPVASKCCSRDAAYLLYTDAFTWFASQVSADAPITLGICTDTTFLASLKDLSAFIPEDDGMDATSSINHESNRKLLAHDEYTYTTIASPDGCTVSDGRRNSYPCAVQEGSEGCVGFPSPGDSGAPSHCIVWSDAHGVEHRSNAWIAGYSAGKPRTYTHVGAVDKAEGLVNHVHQGADHLANYCMDLKFGGRGRIYGRYQINKCSGRALQGDFWSYAEDYVMNTLGGELDVWGWAATLYARTGDKAYHHMAGGGPKTAMADSSWDASDFAIIIWHDYSFASASHGGLPDFCLWCYVCRSYIPYVGEEPYLAEPWNPDRDQLTPQGKGGWTDSQVRSSVRLASGTDGEWWKDRSGDCMAHLQDTGVIRTLMYAGNKY
mmetsp:Transcript_22590/g.27252  ORF Transcript_22590/g.27252 Transcript_22590/m.27252 type:complete len:550 (+) Transcript_22590:53-1702(+)